jgi:hypothetical protein
LVLGIGGEGCLLGRRQIVCQTHVEPVALLRAKVVEYGLDLA